MRLHKLELQGVTRYAGKVAVDFDAIGPGVIAIAGPNGAGKTTLLECAGPGVLFRELPTRSPTALANWCDAKAGGMVRLTFEMGGDEYDAELRLDGKGNTVANLGRNGKAMVSGKVREFDAAMAKLVGSRAAFYTSVFGAQGGRGRFAALGVADRKAVFRYYLGLDRVEQAHALAKERLKALPEPASLVALEAKLEAGRDASTVFQDERDKVAEQLLANATSLKDAEARVAAMQEAIDVAELLGRYDAALGEVAELSDELDELEATAPAAPGEAPDVEGAERELAAARTALAMAQELVTAADKAHITLDRAQREAADAESRTKVLGAVPCGGGGEFAGCQFLREAQAARTSLPAKLATCTTLQANYADAMAASRAAPEAEARGRVLLLESQVEALHGRRRVHDAAVRVVATHKARVDAKREELARRKLAAKGLRSKLPTPKPDPASLPVLGDVIAAKARVTVHRNDREALVRKEEILVGSLNRQAAENKATAAAVKDAQDAVRARRPLSLLTWALGPDGVQAFEIDAAGPRVSALANELLTACYGGRFSLDVTTTRELKSKPGTLAEDFSITCYDAERDGVRSLEGLSGGEQVVVDAALRMALALFAVERTGLPVETLFQDETVGALDPDNATRYVLMMHRARELGGFHQVLYVTHDERAIGTATAVVRVGADGSVTVEGGA